MILIPSYTKSNKKGVTGSENHKSRLLSCLLNAGYLVNKDRIREGQGQVAGKNAAKGTGNTRT